MKQLKYNMRKITTYLILTLAMASAWAQGIPNGSFENWTTNGSNITLDNWNFAAGLSRRTSLTVGLQGGGQQIVNPANGQYFIGIQNTVVNSQLSLGFAGLRFAFTQRPVAFRGSFMSFPASPSQTGEGFLVQIYMWKRAGSTIDTICDMIVPVRPQATLFPWGELAVTLNYKKTGNPDSCLLIISNIPNTQGQGSGSQLNVTFMDGLKFSDFGAGSGDISIADIGKANNIKLFPNPVATNSSAKLQFQLTGPSTENKITVTGLDGKVALNMSNQNLKSGLNTMDVSTSGLSKGLYLVTITTEGGTRTEKLLVK